MNYFVSEVFRRIQGILGCISQYKANNMSLLRNKIELMTKTFIICNSLQVKKKILIF